MKLQYFASCYPKIYYEWTLPSVFGCTARKVVWSRRNHVQLKRKLNLASFKMRLLVFRRNSKKFGPTASSLFFDLHPAPVTHKLGPQNHWLSKTRCIKMSRGDRSTRTRSNTWTKSPLDCLSFNNDFSSLAARCVADCRVKVATFVVLLAWLEERYAEQLAIILFIGVSSNSRPANATKKKKRHLHFRGNKITRGDEYACLF